MPEPAAAAGPDLHVARFGHPMPRACHLPDAFGFAERDRWLACMVQAMAQAGLEQALAARLAGAFAGAADRMRNRGG